MSPQNDFKPREMEMALEDFDRQSHASDLEELLRKIFSSKQSQKIDRTTES